MICPYGEEIGQRWSSWEETDEKKKWLKRVKDREEEHTVDLVETFFSNLDLYGFVLLVVVAVFQETGQRCRAW